MHSRGLNPISLVSKVNAWNHCAYKKCVLILVCLLDTYKDARILESKMFLTGIFLFPLFLVFV